MDRVHAGELFLFTKSRREIFRGGGGGVDGGGFHLTGTRFRDLDPNGHFHLTGRTVTTDRSSSVKLVNARGMGFLVGLRVWDGDLDLAHECVLAETIPIVKLHQDFSRRRRNDINQFLIPDGRERPLLDLGFLGRFSNVNLTVWIRETGTIMRYESSGLHDIHRHLVFESVQSIQRSDGVPLATSKINHRPSGYFVGATHIIQGRLCRVALS